jgi:arylsulfatase A-like enzyme
VPTSKHGRWLPATVVVAALAWTFGCSGENVERPSRPHIVFVLLDTLRTDHLSTYGYRWPTTPAIDALAARGAVFEDCTAQASWTLPSMISLLTGQPIFTTIYRLPDALPVLPELLADAGYRTGAVVANSALATDRGFARGVESYSVRQVMKAQWNAAEVTDQALAFIAADDDRPFFLWLHYLDTHEPYTPPRVPFQRPYAELFDPWERQLIEDTLAAAPVAERSRLSAERSGLARQIDRYDGELRFLDNQLTRLFERLDELALTDEVYVVIASDHGETLYRRPEHPQRLKTTREWRTKRGDPMELSDYMKAGHAYWVYQELVRTPLIVVGPGIAPGRRVTEAVSNLDLLPTLLGLARLDLPATPGRDLSVALRSGAPVAPAEFVTSCSDSATSARLPDGTKLILPAAAAARNHGLVPELYRLAIDPLERDPLPLGDQGERLRQRLLEAIATDPFAAWQGEAMDAQTLQRLRELGYLR